MLVKICPQHLFAADLILYSASSLYPSCYTWTMSSSGTSDAYTLFECSPGAGTGVLLGYDPSSFTPSATDTDTGTATETETETDPPTNTGSPSPTREANGGGGGSDTNVGAIAGGAVGGVAALGLVGLAAFLLLRHRRQSKTSPTDSPSVQTITTHPPPKTQSPSTAGTMYPSGAPSGFPPYSQHDSNMSQGHPPQHQYGCAPQPQAQQHGAMQPGQQTVYGGVVYQPGSAPAGSPPPHTTPSLGVASSQGYVSPSGQQRPTSELQTINPRGMETNRAEMG